MADQRFLTKQAMFEEAYKRRRRVIIFSIIALSIVLLYGLFWTFVINSYPVFSSCSKPLDTTSLICNTLELTLNLSIFLIFIQILSVVFLPVALVFLILAIYNFAKMTKLKRRLGKEYWEQAKARKRNNVQS